MTENTLVKFAQVKSTNGAPDWVVGADGGGLVLGKLHRPAGSHDGETDAEGTEIEVWARSARIYDQALKTLEGDSRLLTDPRLALLLASGVVMLSGLLAQQQAVAADLVAKPGDKADV